MGVSIIVAFQKPCDLPQDPAYLPLRVGALGQPNEGAWARDDTGDHISGKNPSYCELTGVYWAWKNLPDTDLGLAHYRRYLARRRVFGKKTPERALPGAEAEKLLRDYAVLVPKKRRYYIETLYSHYAHTHDGRHLDAAREVIRQNAPDYSESCELVFRRRSGYFFNMFIMRRALWDDYCAWLFPLLDALERAVGEGGATGYERRYIGRVSEILFNVWLERAFQMGKLQRAEVLELPCFYTGQVAWGRKLRSFLMAKYFHRKYDSSF